MARVFTTDQLNLLHADSVRANVLTTWHMDDAVYRYSDHTEDLTDIDGNLYIGANALAKCSDIRSGQGFAAEQVVLTIDGTRMQQSGFTDPAALFRAIMTLKLHNRRVDIAYGLSSVSSALEQFSLVIPVYAGKINNPKVTLPQIDLDSAIQDGQPPQPNLDITLDSLAMRYSWITGRTRSDADQQELYPGDRFFKFVNDNLLNESKLYWGQPNPVIATPR